MSNASPPRDNLSTKPSAAYRFEVMPAGFLVLAVGHTCAPLHQPQSEKSSNQSPGCETNVRRSKKTDRAREDILSPGGDASAFHGEIPAELLAPFSIECRLVPPPHGQVPRRRGSRQQCAADQ